MMSEKKTEKSRIKDYLLGKTSSTDEKFEEKLMTDDKFFQEFQIQEEELIQDYVDDNLTDPEKQKFETHFLISKERQEKVVFAQSLRKHIDQKEVITESKAIKVEAEKPKPRNFFSSFFSSPIPVAICLLIIAGLSTILIWNNFLTPSDNEIALASLNKAFKNERPLESRISGFDYAKKRNTRGNDDSNVDKVELENAEFLIRKDARDNQNAATLHALGRFYLANKEFDEAIDQLKKADGLNNKDAQIKNDLGVAYLEKINTLNDEEEEKLELSDKALSNFEESIKNNPKLLEARFNKAIVLQKYAPRQAKKAFEEYIELDPDSKWAEEAKKHLEEIKSKDKKELSSVELENVFWELHKKKDREKIFNIISQNRDAIKGKYMPQLLAMEFVNASDKTKDKYLSGLIYLGELEKEKIKDNFASDLANYYSQVSKNEIVELKQAQILIKKGYAFCLDNKFKKALVEFENGRKAFIKAGNIIEANSITDMFIAYCLFYIDKTKFYQKTLKVHNFTRKNNYRWLKHSNLYWLITVEESLNEESKTKSYNKLKEAFANVKEMDDTYLYQKFLSKLVRTTHFFKQKKKLHFI